MFWGREVLQRKFEHVLFWANGRLVKQPRGSDQAPTICCYQRAFERHFKGLSTENTLYRFCFNVKVNVGFEAGNVLLWQSDHIKDALQLRAVRGTYITSIYYYPPLGPQQGSKCGNGNV